MKAQCFLHKKGLLLLLILTLACYSLFLPLNGTQACCVILQLKGRGFSYRDVFFSCLITTFVHMVFVQKKSQQHLHPSSSFHL